MSRLSRQQYQWQKAREKQQRSRSHRHFSSPRYREDGTVARRSQSEHIHRIKVIAIILALVFLVLYVPGWFMTTKTTQPTSQALAYNSADLNNYQQVLQKKRAEDWDSDGLTNQEEIQLGTSPLNPDTDGDGAYDTYEKQVSHTDPNVYEKNILNQYQKTLDAKNGNDAKSPFLMNNVKMWANDMDSKAHAGVVEVNGGYNFSHFDGLVQFALADGYTAYTVEDDPDLSHGRHVLLDYEDVRTSSSDASQKTRFWKINAKKQDIKVELYKQPLEQALALSLGSHSTYINYNAGAKILAFLLPEKGWLTAKKVARIDVEYDTSDDVTVPIQSIPIDSSNDYRYRKNSNSLSDLEYVYQNLDNGKQGVPVYFQDEHGGALGIIYGYQKNGNLLVADYQSLKPMGTLTITTRAKKVLVNQNSGFQELEYFDYSGLGFDSSRKNSHICFLSPSVGNTTSTLSGNFGDNGVGASTKANASSTQSNSATTTQSSISQTLTKSHQTVPSTSKMNQYGFSSR